MRKTQQVLLIISSVFLASPVVSQNEFTHPSNLSTLSAVPRGCLEIAPAYPAVPSRQLILDGTVQQNVPIVAKAGETGTVPGPETVDIRIRVWRHGCHDPNRSALLMNLSLPAGVSNEAAILLDLNPVVILEDERGEIPLTAVHWEPGVENLISQLVGVYGYFDGAFADGITYILDTESYFLISRYDNFQPGLFDEIVSRYNAGGQLKMTFAHDLSVTGQIPNYDRKLDRPQQTKPSLTGRMTGQWVADGLPATGLLLQIGEIPKQYRNFIFAIWFTYIDGQPVWMAANKDIPVGTNEITLDMSYFEGGKLFTTSGGFNSGDVSATSLGTMTLRMINCNEIEATTDFSSSGFGSKTLKLERLIRIAGYDCDGTQAIK